MSKRLILLRPQPGNDQSAERARALGLDVVQIPLFEIVPVEEGALPDGPYDALLVTSANGARHGEQVLRRFADLPVYVVGETSAEAVRANGAREVHLGGGDAASTVPLIAAAGHRAVLHLCGEDVRPFDPLGLTISRHIVYRSEPRDARAFTKALASRPPAVLAVHSPRAGRRLNALMPPAHRNHMLIAISEAAAAGAGRGWRAIHVSPTPDDSALLDLARTLCMDAL
jgi:uroporphyrinogen-III synthase